MSFLHPPLSHLSDFQFDDDQRDEDNNDSKADESNGEKGENVAHFTLTGTRVTVWFVVILLSYEKKGEVGQVIHCST